MKRWSLEFGAFALLALVGSANAQTYQVGQYLGNMNDINRFTYNTMGSAAQHANYGAGGANWTTLAGQNAARMAGTATATIGGRTVPLTLISRVPLPAIVTGLRSAAAMNPGVAAAVLLGGLAMDHWLTQSQLRWNTDPSTNVQYPLVREEPRFSCYASTQAWNDPSAWCRSALSNSSVTGAVVDVQVAGGSCTYRVQCSTGYRSGTYVAVLQDQTVELVPYTWEMAEPLMTDSAARDYSAVDWKGVTEKLLRAGGSIDPAQITSTVSGPASQPGEKVTTTGTNAQGQPTTTTKQTTHNYTYNSNNVTHNTTTTTTTINNVTNQVENETTEETENETPPESATDTPLPSVPDFYEQKYKDGLVGVWASHKAAYQATSLGTFVLKLMPSGLGAGQCPQWTLNLDVGIFNGGDWDVSIDCQWWQAARLLMIIGALFLARRLVFGG